MHVRVAHDHASYIRSSINSSANDILGIEVQTEGENVLLADPRSVSPYLTRQILPVLVDDTLAASPNLTAPNQTALLVEQPCT